MITIHPTADQIAEAREDARRMGVLPNSKTFGRGNAIGMLAEIVTSEWMTAERVRPPVYSHDLVRDGITYDVKARRCSGEPLPEYAAGVFAKDGKHGIKADRLLFTRVLDDLSTVYIVGWLTTRQFARRSEFIKAGTRDGGFITRADCFSLPIARLLKAELLAPSLVG